MLDLTVPNPANEFHGHHVGLVLDSYRELLGTPLLRPLPGQSLGEAAFNAGFALLSHTADADPLFNYANRQALALFEFEWQELVGLPSRFSAEPVNRAERERLLAQVSSRGYIDDYSGVRIAKSGKRFLIEHAVVWNVYDQWRRYYGQAACFSDWRLLP